MSQIPREHSLKNARGVALVSVLLIVALISALASQIISQHSLTIAYARQSFNATQAREYAIGAEMFARQLLFEDWSESGQSKGIDTLFDNWVRPNAPFELEEGILELTIRDLDGRLNLNGVVGKRGPETMQRLKRLMNNLGLDSNIADAWLDWVDHNREIYGFGAEDAEYLGAKTPYRAANQPAASLSELFAISNFKRNDFELLKDNTTVLPTNDSKININTASYEVLSSLNQDLSGADLDGLVASAREFEDVAGVTALYPSFRGSADIMKVKSEYFEVQVRVTSSMSRCELTSLLYRDSRNGKIRLLARDFGRRYEGSLVRVAS